MGIKPDPSPPLACYNLINKIDYCAQTVKISMLSLKKIIHQNQECKAKNQKHENLSPFINRENVILWMLTMPLPLSFPLEYVTMKIHLFSHHFSSHFAIQISEDFLTLCHNPKGLLVWSNSEKFSRHYALLKPIIDFLQTGYNCMRKNVSTKSATIFKHDIVGKSLTPWKLHQEMELNRSPDLTKIQFKKSISQIVLI